MPRGLRSVLAVIGGYFATAFVIIALTLLCVAAFHLQPGRPTSSYLAVNVVYSLAAAALGGFMAARIAGYKPLQHGVALAALMLLVGLLLVVHPPTGQPMWHVWTLTLLQPVFTIAGAARVR